MFVRAVQQALIRQEKSRAGPALPGVASRFTTAADSQRLAGKVAVITGAASGIGAATAREFVRNGAKIVAAAVDLAVARHGRLDVVFNNAGVVGSLSRPALVALDLADLDRVMAVNARGVVAGVKHAARVMINTNIICTASVVGVLGGVTPHPYSVSKAAVIGLVRAVAGELARSGVRVNAISPNYIATPLVMRILEEWLIVERGMNEMEGVLLEPEDVARAALYLASDESKTPST
ncbi:hypothetical protein SETIT_2G422200v2 [Setaria italica]|uniref:Uncharacterized protein n=1 Tax=Setaria italica TaxID=4555 RepID=A0A368Q951_SETIT|nr:hypothetical protein SETIT_2G422200v2 [Setaria italica]